MKKMHSIFAFGANFSSQTNIKWQEVGCPVEKTSGTGGAMKNLSAVWWKNRRKRPILLKFRVSKNFAKLAVKCKMRADDTKLTQKSRSWQNFTRKAKIYTNLCD
jgi:hypothetical protein